MTANLVVPSSVPYQGQVLAVPCKWQQKPPEGSKAVPIPIDWGVQGGSNKVVDVNVQMNATLNLSQIGSVVVNNSRCAVDVWIIFPDTSQLYRIPAFAGVAEFMVVTQQTQFKVYAPNAQSTDYTMLTVLNEVGPSVYIPASLVSQSVSQLTGIDLHTNGTTALLASGNGIIQGVQMRSFMVGGSLSSIVVSLVDGAGTVFMNALTGSTNSAATTNTIDEVFNISGLELPFVNGLNLVRSAEFGTSAGSVGTCNIFYKTTAA